MLNKRILIKEPFNEQYTLQIDSNMMAVNAIMRSKTQIRWDFTVIEVRQETLELRLILLDQALLESNNPLIKEVANLTRTFARMYNELHLITDHKGNIKQILNRSAILSKWQQTKAELGAIAENTPEIKNVVLLNDNTFQDEKKLIDTLQKSEFFMLYFNSFFGDILPYYDPGFIMPNFLNTANLRWVKEVKLKEGPQRNEFINLSLESRPIQMPADFNERAYIQFKDRLDIKKLKPELLETGEYSIELATGRVWESKLKRKEIADSIQLYSFVDYHFISDKAKQKAALQPNLTQNAYSA